VAIQKIAKTICQPYHLSHASVKSEKFVPDLLHFTVFTDIFILIKAMKQKGYHRGTSGIKQRY
jgi:hypothetical protein